MAANSKLIGFTLTNGATLATPTAYGGGVYCPSTSPIISNCIIVGNSVRNYGGGVYCGTLYNCTLTGNFSVWAGGGASDSILYNCTLTGNFAAWIGGGAYNSTLFNCALTGNFGRGTHGCTLSNCTLTGNSGGGSAHGTLYNCTLTGNFAPSYGGGAYAGTLYNCLVAGNSSGWGGGGVCYNGTYYNCTIVGNAAVRGGGVFGQSDSQPKLYNCIVYFNSGDGANWYSSGGSGYCHFTNCCTIPTNTVWASGNFTNDPMFINKGSGYGTNDFVAGNYRLSRGSPCINAGLNQDWMTNTWAQVDLDGRSRKDKFSGQVDIGAYEHLPGGMMFKSGR